MNNQYTAQVSAWKYGKPIFVCFLLCWLIIPLIVMIVFFLKAKKEKYEFNGLRYTIYEGNMSNSTVQRAIPDILSINVERSFMGKIFNYGNVYCQTTHKMGNSFNYVKNPEALRDFLETQINTNNQATL